ncbi:hypothetical protein ANCDUO_22019 [Ancylostoma duodenale]|uniref:Uncharacterized protein n=1 Tax=Ancylostoma duodenale TaxID=51022 RepID=A0A0C2FSP6_9BILA|nr:hypothetical protein ANCDUO_22019 [Ancylostoma duodenale]
MVEKGVIYRAFKPVYWLVVFCKLSLLLRSPSSRTALAESELEYNEKHMSTTVFFRFRMINVSPEDIGFSVGSKPKPLIIYALVSFNCLITTSQKPNCHFGGVDFNIMDSSSE